MIYIHCKSYNGHALFTDMAVMYIVSFSIYLQYASIQYKKLFLRLTKASANITGMSF